MGVTSSIMGLSIARMRDASWATLGRSSEERPINHRLSILFQPFYPLSIHGVAEIYHRLPSDGIDPVWRNFG